MTRTVIHAGFLLIAGWIVLSACGIGTEGLAFDPADDGATPEGSTGNPGSSDSPAVGDDSSFEGSTGDAQTTLGDDGSQETASPVEEASDAIVGVGPDATSNGSDANDATSDANDAAEGGADASSDRSISDGSGGETGALDSAAEAASCNLKGATICCGSVPCADHGGSCRAQGVCDVCNMQCDSELPICCALNGNVVKCEKLLTDC